MSERDAANGAEIMERTDEYRRLAEKHRKCEERLAELRGRLLLSEPEKLEEVTLKKQKLALKDRMEAIARGPHSVGPAKNG
jgi:uncharacterized protein YdcH (DUF465 family)